MRWNPMTAKPREETTEQLAIHLLKNSTGEWNSLTPERLRAVAERMMMLKDLPQNYNQGTLIQAADRFKRPA